MRARWWQGRERPLGSVPRLVMVLLGLALALQGLWHAAQPRVAPSARALPMPPSVAALSVLGLGERVALAKLLMLWLQSFDNQPGISIPYRELDYPRLIAWLERILALDPKSSYPLLASSRLYAMVPDATRQRQMLEFVYAQSLLDPDRRWRWLAEASLIAKYRLRDLPLALKYAEAITQRARAAQVPYWARDLSLIVLADMQEHEAARGLLGALIAEGRITDPRERAFLERRLSGPDAAGEGAGDENSTAR